MDHRRTPIATVWCGTACHTTPAMDHRRTPLPQCSVELPATQRPQLWTTGGGHHCHSAVWNCLSHNDPSYGPQEDTIATVQCGTVCHTTTPAMDHRRTPLPQCDVELPVTQRPQLWTTGGGHHCHCVMWSCHTTTPAMDHRRRTPLPQCDVELLHNDPSYGPQADTIARVWCGSVCHTTTPAMDHRRTPLPQCDVELSVTRPQLWTTGGEHYCTMAFPL